MSFFSSLLKIMFITASVTPLYSETTFASLKHSRSEEPNCDAYKPPLHFCTREYDPICATNGKTYSNECDFCSTMRESNRSFGFKHHGKCN